MRENYNIGCTKQHKSEIKKTEAIKTLAYLIKKYANELPNENK